MVDQPIQVPPINPEAPNETSNRNLIYSSDFNADLDSVSSISKLLTNISDYPDTLRREFRGEMAYEDDEGNIHWVQGTKPIFIKVDFETNRPLMESVEMPWGETKECFIANDEAIEEVLSMLKFVGINKITPVGFNQEDNYLEELKEFECKLAGILALKQKEWGLDKELLPMIHFKLKTIIQDVRSLSIKGNLLKALTQTVQRVEQYIENETTRRKKTDFSPY